MKAMNSVSRVVFAAVTSLAVMGSGIASAAPTIDPGPDTYRFATDDNLVRLTKGTWFPVNLDCELWLEGDVAVSGSKVIITVTNGAASAGDFGCGTVGFTFPWVAEVDETDLGTSSTDPKIVNGVFQGVTVSTIIGNCTGDVAVSYSNVAGSGDNRSIFTFNNATFGSDCKVSGTLYADPVDVNAYQ